MAERLGKITLAIRAVDGVAEATGRRSSVYGGDVSPALADGTTPGAPRMRVIEGKDSPRGDLPMMTVIATPRSGAIQPLTRFPHRSLAMTCAMPASLSCFRDMTSLASVIERRFYRC